MLIRVVRDVGGLGDMIRLFAVCNGLKAKYPGCQLHFYGPVRYRELMFHCPAIDVYVDIRPEQRRPRGAPLEEARFEFLRRGFRYDLSLDMYCPAWDHEAKTRGSCTVGRVKLWCQAAGVEPGPINYEPTRSEQVAALHWLADLPAPPERVVALHPFSVSHARGWDRKRWHGLIVLLTAADFYPVMFHNQPGAVAAFDCRRETENSFVELAAKLWALRALIAVDSGLLHVAGAVGTATLGIFGLTNGQLVCGPYSATHEWITGVVNVVCPPTCSPPCYGFRERGWRPAICHRNGCAVARSVTAETVMERFLAMIKPPSRTEALMAN